MATHGQTINDRLNAARYTLAGQGLARCVCKATTEQVIGPKKKHLDYLVQCTQEANVSIPQLANLLIERTNHTSWVVVFKALVTVHHLMCYGNERFTQYLASSNYTFQLSSFQNKATLKDSSMSTFIRRYSKYINEKALTYRNLAFDLCKIKRGTDGVMRNMPTDKLLKTITVLQAQLDSLLEFDCNANDLNNGVISAAFMQLYRDLISLYAGHNDGMITILARYFEEFNKKQCKEAYDVYKKFLIQMDKVSDFLKVAEDVGIDRDNIPDLMKVPSSLLDSLGQHLNDIDSSKKTRPSVVSSTGKSAINLTRPSTPGSSNLAGADEFLLSTDEFLLTSNEEVRKALEDEAKALQQFSKMPAGTSINKAMKNLTSELVSTSNTATTNTNSNRNNTASINMANIVPNPVPNLAPNPAHQFDVFGDLLQPVPVSDISTSVAPGQNNLNNNSINSIANNMRGDDLFSGNMMPTLRPTNQNGTNSSSLASTGLFKGDLDSTLANLAQNLTFDGIPKIKK